MSNDANPFPESDEKDYLRNYHFLNSLADQNESIGRPLNYFGLPSAEMRDVATWQPLLGNITAVERDPDLAFALYKTAQKLGIRNRTIVIEMQLAEIADLLAMEEKQARLSLASLWPNVQEKVNKVRQIHYDVINLDLCGGFLYSKKEESENAKILRNLIEYQAKQKTTFILIVTFALRDMGKAYYDEFIKETLDQLESLKINISEVRDFYTAKKVDGQPPNLRRLRFCFPVYLHKISFDHFQVRSLGAWYYKTFYHTALLFELRKGGNLLGKAWPPLDEFKDLLRVQMVRLEADDSRQVVRKLLPAPIIPD